MEMLLWILQEYYQFQKNISLNMICLKLQKTKYVKIT